uniref:VWFD domain-containing protein n=1 Tax=Leptobrachium leishanense TaxID=445787 RepID=A0A8C5QZ52_9ANUR
MLFFLPRSMMGCDWGPIMRATILLLIYSTVTRGQPQPAGKEFITVFMQNHSPEDIAYLQLQVTGSKPDTSVEVTINKSNYKQKFKVGSGETVLLPMSGMIEMKGTGRFSSSVVVKADADVTVSSSSYKPTGAESTLVYPVAALGVEYFVVTPPWGPACGYKQFAIVAYNQPTSVEIHLTQDIKFQGRDYSKGQKLSITLEPYQAVQIQCPKDLSGTRVLAQNPVAMLCGHTCTQINEQCNYALEQILPVTAWGLNYLIPAFSFQQDSNVVLIMPSKDFSLDYQLGGDSKSVPITRGKLHQIQVGPSQPLEIHSKEKIQVLLYSKAGIHDGVPYGSFLSHIPDETLFHQAFVIHGQREFQRNMAIFIVETAEKDGVLIDGKALGKDHPWQQFPKSKYSFAEHNFGPGISFHSIQHPKVPIGVISAGFTSCTAYGFIAEPTDGKIVNPRGRVELQGGLEVQFPGGKESTVNIEYPSWPGGVPGEWSPGGQYPGGIDVTTVGRQFVTAFLKNGNSKEAPEMKLLVTGIAPSTTVTATVSGSNFKKKIQVKAGETKSLPITEPVELSGTGTSSKSVVVKADAGVTIVSSSSRNGSSDTALIYPLPRWGFIYYIVTPPWGPATQYAEIAVIASDKPTNVTIHLKGDVNFQDHVYPKGSKLHLTLEPHQVVQLQSTGDISGSRVEAQHPISVLSGHTGSQKYGPCGHVYENLLPVESWGTTYFIPGMSSQTNPDIVFVVAYKDTKIDYKQGTQKQTKSMADGDVMQLEVTPSQPLSIQGSEKFQVIFYGTGGAFKGQNLIPFLSNIQPIEEYGLRYILNGNPERGKNVGVITIKTSGKEGILADGKPAKGITWKEFPESGYSWGEYTTDENPTPFIEHPTQSFGLQSNNYADLFGYGSPAPCIKGPVFPNGGGKDPCKHVQCGPGEKCQVKEGKGTCVPKSVGICWAWGDPHYKSFDGYKFDLQGTCTYILSKYEGDVNGLQAFSVEEKNEFRGKKEVAYVRLVTVRVYGHILSIKKGESPRVRVDGVLQNLPVTLGGGKVKIVRSGKNAQIITDFGLKINFDWNWQVTIYLPSSYHGLTTGLCGNLNGNPQDDMLTTSKTLATSITEWAQSWKVNDQDPFCVDACVGECPSCNEEQKRQYEAETWCGLIRKNNGPFAKCQPVIDPENFFTNCMFDVCMNGGARIILCQALEAYATECMTQGLDVSLWRDKANCPMQCPVNSHYEACGNACPASCADRTAPADCIDPCMETCQCNSGYILSGEKCVPVTSCGCSYNGFYYEPNEKYWADQACNSYCVCDPASGKVVCQDKKCKSNEKCMVVDGKRGCHPSGYSTCTFSGDPHYYTFDGTKFDFMGTCTYQLVKVTSTDPSLTPFTVTVQNNNRGNKAVSFTREVTLEVYNQTIVLSADSPRKIQVNGVHTHLPYYYETSKVVGYLRGLHAVIKLDNGLILTFDWNSHGRVTLPDTYANSVTGLCGNNNKNPSDDLTTSSGQKTADPVEFGDSWKVRDVPGCSKQCVGKCPTCTEQSKSKYQSDEYCGIIKKANGPFAQCHASIDAVGYFDDCVFDSCHFEGQSSVLMNAIMHYASACQAAGIVIREWRTSLTRLVCPPNSHYELCGPGCAPTCYDLSYPQTCQPSCTEGCYCDDGFILSGEYCVPISQCGCTLNERYYEKGQKFYTNSSCGMWCECRDEGRLSCETLPCGPNDHCRVVNGVQSCVSDRCAKCTVSGVHYISFDGLPYNFYGTCSYTLVSSTSRVAGIEKFSVMVENEKLGALIVPKRVKVAVFRNEYTLERLKTWKVKINDQIANLPFNCPTQRLWINQEGKNIILQTDFGMKVLFDLDYQIIVQITGTYWNSVRGLCGNFNDDLTDEMAIPDGTIVSKVDSFGAGWKVPVEGVSCMGGCGDACPAITSKVSTDYGKETQCGMIKATKGPFKDCFSKIYPLSYYNNCLLDMSQDPSSSTLCRSLQAYVSVCEAAGGNVKSWRTDKFCPLSCTRGQYSNCSRTCDQACAVMSASSTCTSRCFEGCSCSDEEFFDGEQCVSKDKCGCMYGGQYLKVKESLILSGCRKQCKCQEGGMVTCEPFACSAGETCFSREVTGQCVKA